MQSMGWGVLRIAVKGKEMRLEITSPPCGLQKEGENWEFLAKTILGYLWLIDRKLTIKDIQKKGRCLTIIYSR
jgi:hypothetical protein